MANILIIDDDRMVREALILQLTSMEHTSIVAETLAEGLGMIGVVPLDVVLLDVHLPDGDGLKALPTFRDAPSRPEVIIITGEGSARGAELAIDNGAWDYIQKPLSKNEIALQLARALEYRLSKIESQKKTLVTLKRVEIIGNSPALNARLDMAAQCAASDAHVLLSGETGTGKERFAKLIHENSFAAENKFVVVDCAALPAQLAESVLFGHVKGAFTGADGERNGLVHEADGGTLFLDEVGELPLSMQTKFLRVLQERRFKPVGSTRDSTSDFRLISATNRNLDEMVAKGSFREDLLHRLRTFHIDLPPLRSCKQDIRDLVLYYIDRLSRHHHLENRGFAPEFIDCLESYHWPGNVRELINTLEKALLSDREAPKLFPVHLPRHIRLSSIRSSLEGKQDDGPAHLPGEERDSKKTNMAEISIPFGLISSYPPLKQLREEVITQVEEAYLNNLMPHAGHDLDRVSKISGLSKPRLYALLKKYNISRK